MYVCVDSVEVCVACTSQGILALLASERILEVGSMETVRPSSLSPLSTSLQTAEEKRGQGST